MNNMTTINVQHLKVRPTSRGVRIWLEGSRLTEAGFLKGARYSRHIESGRIVLRLDPEGKYKVSGKAKPIIDLSSKGFDGFTAGQDITATHYGYGLIEIK